MYCRTATQIAGGKYEIWKIKELQNTSGRRWKWYYSHATKCFPLFLYWGKLSPAHYHTRSTSPCSISSSLFFTHQHQRAIHLPDWKMDGEDSEESLTFNLCWIILIWHLTCWLMGNSMALVGKQSERWMSLMPELSSPRTTTTLYYYCVWGCAHPSLFMLHKQEWICHIRYLLSFV